MPHFVVDKVQDSLNAKEKPVKGSRIHVLGVAYKRDIDDLRESPALDVIHLLSQKGGIVTYSDPYVPELDFEDGRKMRSDDPISALSRSDCGVIITDHACFDYAAILAAAPLIVDTRNAMKGMNSDKIVRL